MKNIVKKLPVLGRWYLKLDNLNERREFVKESLQRIPEGRSLLDAGCGSQQFREFAKHLNYSAQDFGQYTADDKQMMGAKEGGLGADTYEYGKLDYVGDIWDIDEVDEKFDSILCTEVLEHIPYPIETIKEFSRLLKPGGTLILTAPSNCLRHMDPYFFYTGFSDRWYEHFLDAYGLEIEICDAVGGYYNWLGVEVFRTMRSHGILSKICLLPAFLYYFNKKETELSVDTLAAGYHIVAKKK